jgi:hypothetical protein
MKHVCWLVMALLLSPIAHSQQIEKVQPAATVRNDLFSGPMGVAREVGATARDFVTFRDPAWSVLTIGQIGAASVDAHKYIIGGAIEIGVGAVTAHYFRNHGPIRKWYWKALWTVPQSFSLYEHARAAQHNAALNLGCFSSSPTCH